MSFFPPRATLNLGGLWETNRGLAAAGASRNPRRLTVLRVLAPPRPAAESANHSTHRGRVPFLERMWGATDPGDLRGRLRKSCGEGSALMG